MKASFVAYDIEGLYKKSNLKIIKVWMSKAPQNGN
jgi:hypothetical protein